MPGLKRILGIEDNDHKWERIHDVIRRTVGDTAEVVRAVDQIEGNALVDQGGWDLILLDMSLDIRRTADRSGKGGHDFTGGLKIAGRMYYLRKEAPTVIITGFDAFPSGRSGQNEDVILGFEDIERQALAYLGTHLIATLRYGPSDWERKLSNLLKELISQ